MNWVALLSLVTCVAFTVCAAAVREAFIGDVGVRIFNASESDGILYGGVEISRGSGNSWGFPCDRHFRAKTANVICRMFNFTKGEGVGSGILGNSSQDYFPESLRCTGTERSLSECTVRLADSSCSTDEGVGVVCFNDTKDVLDVRVVNGTVTPVHLQGRLEVRLRPVLDWGTVCDDGFTSRSAASACRYLGYKYGELADEGIYGDGNAINLDEVTCEANQEFLDCDHDIWTSHDCSHVEDAGILCTNATVRLLSAVQKDYHIGSVELFLSNSGGWFEVCDENWDDDDAKVVCRELGFADGIALKQNTLGLVSYGSVTAYGSVTKVNCSGSEKDLASCGMERLSVCAFTGPIINLAATICYDTTVDQIDMTDSARITPHDESILQAGFLEIRHLGVWGMVCEDKQIFSEVPVSDKEAAVTCRMMGEGYVGGKRLGRVRYDVKNNHVWLRGFSCNGNESTISECKLPQWGSPGLVSCAAPVRVVCYKQELKLELRHGDMEKGLLYMHLDGETSAVCGDDWTDVEAHAACTEMGFIGGKAWSMDQSVSDYSTIIRDIKCSEEKDGFFSCIKDKWGLPKTRCNSGPAGVKCFKRVKLDPGRDSAGILQMYNETLGQWFAFCRAGFDHIDARVACKEFGYTEGALLPEGAFGAYFSNYMRSGVNCSGAEQSIAECPYSTSRITCRAGSYMSISCYNNTTPGTYRLDNGPTPTSLQASGTLRIYQNQTWGYACDESFTDEDARVFCREVRSPDGAHFQHGVKLTSIENIYGPYFVTYPNCTHTASSVSDCNSQTYLCSEKKAASVLCTINDAPQILVAGNAESHAGRLRITAGNLYGAICANKWTDTDASVACRQVSPKFKTGTARVYHHDDSDFYISGINCTGNERTLWQCSSDGFRNVNTSACGPNTEEAGVACFENVILRNQTFTEETVSGTLSLLHSGRITYVCFDQYFTHELAQMACKELGHEHAALLAPRTSDNQNAYNMLTAFRCEDKDSLGDCDVSYGYCREGAVRLLCYDSDVTDVTGWTIGDGTQPGIGQLTRNLFDKYTGVVCPTSFKNEDAQHMCTKKTYTKGKALGSPPFTGNEKELVWFGNLTCKDRCYFQKNVTRSCIFATHSAGVICRNNQGDIHLRLMDHDKVATVAGRVEISDGNNWGTVCNQNGGLLNGRVLCRELGFVDGTTVEPTRPGSTKLFGAGTGNIYLKNVTCTNRDNLFLGCSNAGWLKTDGCTHNDDLEVICYSSIRLYPNELSHYGAVAAFRNGVYRFVCSDNFTDVEASVMCRSMGYARGRAICCSGLYLSNILRIGVSRFRCQGNEDRLSDCPHLNIGDRNACPSQTFASVACSNLPNNGNFSVLIEHVDKGRVIIDHYDLQGGICYDGFDHKDAQVVCRQAGFYAGIAFSADIIGLTMTWTTGLQCQGSESRLQDCPNFQLGRTQRCRAAAHVMCLGQNVDSDIKVRLKDGPSKNIGRLEVQINGTWGSVCHSDTRFLGNEAKVICKQLGFSRGGQLSIPGRFGPSQGSVLLTRLTCQGNESNIKECDMKAPNNLSSTPCSSHLLDMTIECFSHIRFVNGPPNDKSRGQPQIASNTTGVSTWHYVCDTGIRPIEANVICKDLGYEYGKKQCCNPSGPAESTDNPISSITCPSAESAFRTCNIGQPIAACDSGYFAYVHCSQTPFSEERISKVEMQNFIGVPTIKRFGIEGAICADGLGQAEAHVMCRDLGYATGHLLSPANMQNGSIIMLKGLNCTGSENSISDCRYPNLSEAGSCSTFKLAQIMCLLSRSPVTYQLNEQTDANEGRAEIIIDSRAKYIHSFAMGDTEASVFCRSIKNKTYAYGEVYNHIIAGGVDAPSILMTNVHCNGDESSILECKAHYLPQFSETSTTRLAFLRCHKGVELQQGPFGSKSSGILTLYSSKIEDFGAICEANFDTSDADVACRMLGFTNGLVHCCLPFGYNYYDVYFKNFGCTGRETSLFDCKHEAAKTYSPFYCSSRQDYVGITCYNGIKPRDFSLTILGSATDPNTGLLQVNYLNTSGTICNEKWDDNDAKVACSQLGYSNGYAYSHYRPTFSVSEDAGPFWLGNVQCTGTETQLSECKHTGLGNVTSCPRGHYAGVLCTQGSEIEFRIVGTDKPHYGRLEVRIEDRWGTVCDRYWDARDASVLCRQLGYVTGDVFDTDKISPGQGPVWEIGSRCTGKEDTLNQCPHEGWKAALSGSCATHARDAGVFCYTSVSLATGAGKEYNHGPVRYYHEEEWVEVCDDGFSDMSARKVCQELGYYDGQAICCSAYTGEALNRNPHPNITISCVGDEVSLQDCIKFEPCDSSFYASVTCLETEPNSTDTGYSFTLKKDSDADFGRIDVTHMRVTGRICGNGWDDDDAKVFCREWGNYVNGFAYYHSYEETYMSAETIGPFLLSNVSCNGTETELSACNFMDQYELGNCSGSGTAGAVCFTNEGVRYRLSGNEGSTTNVGRVEMSIDGLWGTVCGTTWDNDDARVACRQQGFTDGEAEKTGKYGKGTGPIWLRDIQCNGHETALHRCPHTGFNNDVPDRSVEISPWPQPPCMSHADDAAVFCFKDAKLNQKLGFSTGALLFSHNGDWVHVCDSRSFSNSEAQIACKSLLQDYVDGVPIAGGVFGDMEHPLSVSSIQCTGNEEFLSECQVTATGDCASKTYISVACFNTTLTSQDLAFQVRLSEDSIRSGDNHGILEIRERGAWGRICMKGFSDKEASVACRELNNGFTGGVSYLHLYRNRLPILWNGVSCRGDEISLQQCIFNATTDLENCPYNANDAGVLCYKGEGIKFRLQSSKSDKSSGRVEIGIDGNYGTVCAVNWHAKNARVLCRYLNYTDGIPSYETDSDLEYLSPLMSFFLCNGKENNLLSCLNSGFDDGDNVFFCGGDAYTQCFNEEVRITNMRLGDGEKTEGRVEVFASGLNKWGTVCDDVWGDLDARVFCRFLGFTDGEAIELSGPQGEGHIFLDNVECNGTEDSLDQCRHNGINSHNCEHSEDAAVRCFNEAPKTTASPVTTASTASTTSTTTTTTRRTTSTTKKPTTFTTKLSPVTTKLPPTVSTSTSTARPTTPSRSPTTTSTSAMTSSTIEGGANTGEQNSKEGDNKTNVIVAVVVTIVVAVVLIVVTIIVVFKCRMRSKSAIPHERFHDDVIEHGRDGSVAVSNRMFDMTSPDGDPMADGSEIHLDRAGYVTFSKGHPPSSEQQSNQDGFSNPLYAAMQNASEVEANGHNLNQTTT